MNIKYLHKYDKWFAQFVLHRKTESVQCQISILTSNFQSSVLKDHDKSRCHNHAVHEKERE